MIEGVVYGKYELLSVLGRGGMSDVFLAVARGPAGFQKLVVLKELRPELSQDRDHLSMFFAEARLGARFSHPALTHVFDVCHESGRPFLVMEYLDGQPLHRLLAKLPEASPLPLGVHLALVAEVLAGLHYAHDLADHDGTALGVVHRDVSPHNVFLTYDGRVKLVDFGIAKGLDGAIDTRSGVVKGKAAYMSPEQALGERVDRRADVYSAGVMIWEALTGVRLFRGMHEVTIIGRLMLGEIPNPRTVRADVDLELEAVCMRALAHDPETRFQTADELRRALLLAMASAGLSPSLDDAARILQETFELEQSRFREQLARRLGRRGLHITDASSGTDRSSPALGLTPLEFVTGGDEGRITSRPPSSGGRDVPTLPPPGARRKRRKLAVVAAVAAALATVAAVYLARRGAPDRTAAAPAAAATLPGPDDCGAGPKPVIEISGDVEKSAVLSCTREYLLRFTTYVRPGVTLTLEPGTVVRGDVDSRAALVVQPGARLVAEGTPERPIVFTSQRPAAERRPGDWGGVVLLGRAPTNLRDERQAPMRGKVEGLTTGGDYGGSDEGDDSGILRYVRIEYAGYELGPGNELNGLTLAGVGRGTVIDNVQVRSASDDCFEFFGGTVDAKHLLCQGAGDDGFDWDLGYHGRLQFLIFQQRPDAPDGANAFEGDNDPSGGDNEPRSNPTIWNATLCGSGTTSGGEQYGLLARRRSGGFVGNALFAGFDAVADFRGSGTATRVEGSVFLGNAEPVAYGESGSSPTDGPGADDDDGFDEAAALLAPEHRNRVGGITLPGCLDAAHPRFAPERGAATSAAAPPDDGFFDASARFVGAVRDGRDDWATARWTEWKAN